MKNIRVYILLLITAMMAGQGIYAQVFNYGSLYLDTGGSIGIHADFTNASTATLMNKGNIYVLYDISQDGITNYDGGALKLTGDSMQIISGQQTFKTTDLQFSNPAGFQVLKKISIAGNVVFTNGIVMAKDSLEPLEFNPDGTGTTAILPVSPSDTSHVDGYVLQTGTGNFDYPVGDSTRYQPVKINIGNNTGGMLVRYYPEDGGNAPFLTTGLDATPLQQYNQMEYWNIQSLDTGSAGVVTVYYDDYNNSGAGQGYLTELKVAHKSDAGWKNEGGIVNGTEAAGSVSSIGSLNTFGRFTLGSTRETPLHVDLFDFGAEAANCNVILQWSSGSETDIAGGAYYYIQYSIDGSRFATIDSLKAKGNNSAYRYIHRPQQRGTLFYRVMVTDKGGDISYTGIVSAKINCGKQSISLYPNPVINSGNLYVVLDGYINANAIMYDMLGRRVLSLMSLQDGRNVIDMRSVAAGVYNLVISSEGSGKTFKIIVEQ